MVFSKPRSEAFNMARIASLNRAASLSLGIDGLQAASWLIAQCCLRARWLGMPVVGMNRILPGSQRRVMLGRCTFRSRQPAGRGQLGKPRRALILFSDGPPRRGAAFHVAEAHSNRAPPGWTHYGAFLRSYACSSGSTAYIAGAFGTARGLHHPGRPPSIYAVCQSSSAVEPPLDVSTGMPQSPFYSRRPERGFSSRHGITSSEPRVE
jgi:hypothetical protein